MTNMQGFMMNNQAYELQSNNQVAVLLSQLDSDYIIGVMDDTLNQMFTRFDLIPRPNIAQSFETTFKELLNIYPADIDNINQVRMETYTTIIDHICQKYEIRFIQTETIDLFTLANTLYDLFISKFNMYMIDFYVKLIMNEKESLIPFLNFEELKKSKDQNVIYNKMAFSNDNLLTAIAMQMPNVLRSLSTLDISDHIVYQYIYGPQTDIIEMLENNISPTVPLFTRFNSLLFNESLYGAIITHIRMAFQQTISEVDSDHRIAIS